MDSTELKVLETPLSTAINGRNNNFGIIRLVLALLVIVSHVQELMDGNRSNELLTRLFHTKSFGDVAVDGFFVLSGCMILQSWQHVPELWPYLCKRCLRIYPAFITATLVAALFIGPAIAPQGQYWQSLSLLKVIKSALELYPTVLPFEFSKLHFGDINLSMWTISYEFRCYLLVPLIGALGALGSRRAWPLMAATLAGLQLLIVLPTGNGHGLIHVLLGTFAELARLVMCFSVGCSFYLYRHRISTERPHLFASAGLLVLCLMNARTVHIGVAIFGGYLLLQAAACQNAVLIKLRKLPDISYGVYLYAWPVTQLLLWFNISHGYLPLLVATGVFSAILGTASWYLIEKPALSIRDRLNWGSKPLQSLR